MRGKRNWCEDISPLLRSIKAEKNHGKLLEINGKSYERIGNDMYYDLVTSYIKLIK